MPRKSIAIVINAENPQEAKLMEKIRRQIQDKINAEKRYLNHPITRQKGSEIDYGMGKIRAFEQVLALLK